MFSKQELPMPLAFLWALLLLLFLLPQWWEATGRRPKARGQINMNSWVPNVLLYGHKHPWRCPAIHLLTISHLILGTDLLLFLFRSDFLFFFFPLGRGESSSSKEGLQAETEQRGHFCIHSRDGIRNVKSQQCDKNILGRALQFLYPSFWTLTYILSLLLLKVSQGQFTLQCTAVVSRHVLLYLCRFSEICLWVFLSSSQYYESK